MLSEAAIQEKIERLLKDGEFYERIDKTDIKKIEGQERENENLIPAFSIDQYIRQRGTQSAFITLKSLQLLEILTADQNVSAVKKETLRPDIVCINPETQTLVIFELKKSTQTERQALTELLAYEHEIKNILPFLSNYETQFVLISTDWSVLLQHAVGSAVAWSGKNLLCLSLSIEEESLSFNIVRPDTWKITGTTHFPARSVSSATVYLYEVSPSISEQDVNYRMSLALDIISREADRAGLHGYGLISKDQSGFNERGFFLTICAVSPFSFFKDMIEKGRLSEEDGHLVPEINRIVHEHGSDSGLSSLLEIVKKYAYPILKTFSDPTLEGFFEWELSKKDLELRAEPLELEFWGLPGEYARHYVTNPAVVRHKPNSFPAGTAHWKSPFTGLLLINNLFDPVFLKDGFFRPSDAFRLGLSIGTDIVIRSNRNNKHISKEQLDRMMFWAHIDLINCIDELALYLSSADEVEFLENPLTISANTDHDTEWEAFIEWSHETLFDGADAHSELFNIGLEIGYAISPYDFSLRPGGEKAYVADVRNRLCDFLSEIMRVATKEMTLNEVEKSHRLENIKAKLEVDDVSNISAALKALPLKDVVLIIDDVMVLADMFVPALIHSFGQIAAVNVDWDNLKNGIDSMYSRGVKYPVVFLSANGEIGTASLDNSRHMSWLRPIADRDAEVYVSDSSSGLETVYITTWELLRGGELVQALD